MPSPSDDRHCDGERRGVLIRVDGLVVAGLAAGHSEGSERGNARAVESDRHVPRDSGKQHLEIVGPWGLGTPQPRGLP